VNHIFQKTAFLFDLDGTLVDSSGLHERVFREVLSEYAPELLAHFDYESLKGKSTAESFWDLGIVEASTLETMVNEKQLRYRAAIRGGELSLMPGALETLETLRQLAKRLFVVTGGSRRSVETALAATGIRDFFEDIVTSDDVVSGKPDPDAFLLCLERSGVSAADAVGIEDALNGVEACRAAELDVVLVNNPRLGVSVKPAFPSLVEFRDALALSAESVLA
jgi:HAD superfamily hydrolase (TIGR01509 family)